jgi:2-polyprenyl-3-methyl-5-hydroxy-6-metoxy-1,4-benzoquinol methylase
MAMFILKSNNPDLSYIISKNPNSGMVSKNIRKGTSFGWYGSENEYVVYFKDADNDISYKKHENDNFEYMNLSRYNSPLFLLNTITDYFGGVLKNKHEKDVEGYINEITIPMMEITNLNRVTKLLNYIKGIEVEIILEAGNSYELIVKTNKTLYELMHFMNVVGLFTAIFGDSYLDMTKDLAKKYVKSMNVLDVPYYIRYSFITQVVVSKEMFKLLKDDLEKTERYELELSFGNTGEERRNFVKDHIDFKHSILDVGCGEGFYTLPFSKKLNNNNVYAVDINEEMLTKINKKVDSRGIENVWTFNDLDVYINTMDTEEQLDVLLIEVIEHMSIYEAKKLANKVLTDINFSTLIMTTPNEDFNVHYEMEGMRHPDHDWEMNETEFKDFVGDLMKDKLGYEYEIYQIGDKVNGKSPTQGVVIKKGDNN